MEAPTKVYYYISQSGKNPVKQFINSLQPSQSAKIRRIFLYIESYGLSSVLPHVKKLTGTPFWEIRVLGKDNVRVIYLVPHRSVVLVLHAFLKKDQKTSPADIQTALKRHRDWILRENAN